MAYTIIAPNMQLPWSSSRDEDKKFSKIFLILLVPFLISSIVIPLINIPEKTRQDQEKLPPQLARVVIEKKEIPKPPPPPPKEEKKEEKKEEVKPEPKKEEPKKEEPKPKKEEPKPAKLVEKAREAAQAEINQVRDDLASMRESFDFSDVAPELSQSTGKAAEVNRNIIGNKAKSGSGGIDPSKLSSDTGGGVALAGKETTQVESQLADVAGEASKAAKSKGRDKAYRSDEDVRNVMDRNKGGIFAVYNRELRTNPTLQGKVVFKLIIESDGRVSAASVISSDLNDPKLERKLLIKIKAINFGTSDVLQTTLEYAFDFLPY